MIALEGHVEEVTGAIARREEDELIAAEEEGGGVEIDFNAELLFEELRLAR
jgi:hypothetical protein